MTKLLNAIEDVQVHFHCSIPAPLIANGNEVKKAGWTYFPIIKNNHVLSKSTDDVLKMTRGGQQHACALLLS